MRARAHTQVEDLESGQAEMVPKDELTSAYAHLDIVQDQNAQVCACTRARVRAALDGCMCARVRANSVRVCARAPGRCSKREAITKQRRDTV